MHFKGFNVYCTPKNNSDEPYVSLVEFRVNYPDLMKEKSPLYSINVR